MRSERERKALGRLGEEDKGGGESRMGQAAEKRKGREGEKKKAKGQVALGWLDWEEKKRGAQGRWADPRKKGGQMRIRPKFQKREDSNLNLNFRSQGYLRHKRELKEARRFLKIIGNFKYGGKLKTKIVYTICRPKTGCYKLQC